MQYDTTPKPDLSPELLAYFQKLRAGNPMMGDQTYQGYTPIFDQLIPSSPETGDPTGTGKLSGIVGPGFDPNNPANHANYDPQTGEFTHYYTADTGPDPATLFALATAGMMMLPSMATLGGAGGAAGSAAGGVGGSEVAGGLFNAAKDSQLANLAMGGEALAGYSAAGATPAAVNLNPGGSWWSNLFDSVTGNAHSGTNVLSDVAAGASSAAAGGSGAAEASGAASGLTKFLKDNKTLLGGLLGAYAGGDDSTDTASKEPWAPARPYLMGLLDTGSKMYGERIENPLTSQQKQAYGNLLGIVNGANSAAPSLFAGMTANASGANNYRRKNSLLGA